MIVKQERERERELGKEEDYVCGISLFALWAVA